MIQPNVTEADHNVSVHPAEQGYGKVHFCAVPPAQPMTVTSGPCKTTAARLARAVGGASKPAFQIGDSWGQGTVEILQNREGRAIRCCAGN
jgi:hypothetical protein